MGWYTRGSVSAFSGKKPLPGECKSLPFAQGYYGMGYTFRI